MPFDSPVHQVTPLSPFVFERELVGYPSSKLRYLLDGIRFGFRTGWSADRVSLRPRSANLKSALEHPQVADSYIFEAGRVAGPFIALQFLGFIAVRLVLFGRIINPARGD